MQNRIDAAAERLAQAAGAARQLDGLADLIDRAAPADGYRVQAVVNGAAIAAGRVVIGHKIGLTSAAAQAGFGAAEPMRGLLFADTRLLPDAVVDLAGLCAPRIEGEILLKVGATPDPAMDDAALAATIASVHAGIEIADRRIAGTPGIGEAIADNACCGRVGWAEPGVPLDGLDLPALRMTMHEEGAPTPVSEGVGANSLGTPLAAYRWLVMALAAAGERLTAGQVVLTGALGVPVAMRPDTGYTVAIEGLGSVTVRT